VFLILCQSSLLLAILSELPLETGQVEVKGKIAYVSQEPWLFPGTIRDNIIFGQAYEQDWYRKVLEVTTLEYDFRNLQFRDLTLVGDKGETLSGGQKARINLAR